MIFFSNKKLRKGPVEKFNLIWQKLSSRIRIPKYPKNCADTTTTVSVPEDELFILVHGRIEVLLFPAGSQPGQVAKTSRNTNELIY